jgi:hypothetical protein
MFSALFKYLGFGEEQGLATFMRNEQTSILLKMAQKPPKYK